MPHLVAIVPVLEYCIQLNMPAASAQPGQDTPKVMEL